MSLSRTTALIKKGACAAGVCIGLLAASSSPALAWHGGGSYGNGGGGYGANGNGNGYGYGLGGKPATAKQNAELAVCSGQTFSQPFEAEQDSNYYTLVEGSEFNSGNEGWELKNGAQVLEATRPDGSTGGVLDLPSGSYAVSPPTCVTLQYPTARAWIEGSDGAGGVLAGVSYGSRTGPFGVPVGWLATGSNGGWQLSSPFNVHPELAGGAEGVREVRFVFANFAHGDVHVSGVYVDPRMS